MCPLVHFFGSFPASKFQLMGTTKTPVTGTTKTDYQSPVCFGTHCNLGLIISMLCSTAWRSSFDWQGFEHVSQDDWWWWRQLVERLRKETLFLGGLRYIHWCDLSVFLYICFKIWMAAIMEDITGNGLHQDYWSTYLNLDNEIYMNIVNFSRHRFILMIQK